MPDLRLDFSVPLPPEQAFAIFVEEMNIWWPRQGVFPYSFAPEGTRPLGIQFEARAGGRYYETFTDGSECVIGRITRWQPPTSLHYTWRDPSWQADTKIELAFAAENDGTRVAYAQDGFAGAGVAWLVPYYEVGCEQTLAGYAAHCRATRRVQDLELSQD